MADHVWVVMPVVNGRDLTIAALSDLLAQSVPTKILVVGQGWDPDLRREIEQIAEESQERVYCWSHCPPLPSLSATWNRALRFCWESGAEEALVVNNDVRLDRETVSVLSRARYYDKALFVSAVGVTATQFATREVIDGSSGLPKGFFLGDGPHLSKGGPDFSCFLISREGHAKYPFDEHFIPAFAEDLDMHRRYMLGGDGDKIFSINLPFHHIGGGSQTLKSMTPEQRAAREATINAGSRAYYASKWGGPVNDERWTIPFDSASDQDGVDTPSLQRAIQHPVEA